MSGRAQSRPILNQCIYLSTALEKTGNSSKIKKNGIYIAINSVNLTKNQKYGFQKTEKSLLYIL